MWKSSEWRGLLPVKKEVIRTQVPDYREYFLSVREWLVYLMQGIFLILMAAWFFYRSFWAVPALSPLLIFLLMNTRKKLAKKRRQELAIQFRDWILAVSSGLQAGYSMENAFLEAGRDMEGLHGKNSLIVMETERMKRGVRSNVPLEELLLDLGKRSGEEDIENFAEVFSIAKRTGGNLNRIIGRSAEMIGDKIAVKREIHTLLSSRRYEQKIMNLIPFLIIAYLQFTSEGFFDVLYGNLPGILIMTAALAVYLAAFQISERIVEIEV